MYEIRIHGRGGQGAVMAGGILAAALVNEGKHVVAVPSFGFERRGAPVASFLRMDTREIRQMTNIYRPDCVLCIDPTVGRAVNVFDGIRDNGTWIQTTGKPIGELEVPDKVATVGLCDAVAIALGALAGRWPGLLLAIVLVAILAFQVATKMGKKQGGGFAAGLWLGLSRPAAVRFAFLVGIPTMFAIAPIRGKGPAVVAGLGEAEGHVRPHRPSARARETDTVS